MPMSAADRSFTTPAVITCVLYFLIGVPGIVANILYLREANKVQRLTGRPPEGKGCLVAMLWVIGMPIILITCVVFAILLSVAGFSAFELPDLIDDVSNQNT